MARKPPKRTDADLDRVVSGLYAYQDTSRATFQADTALSPARGDVVWHHLPADKADLIFQQASTVEAGIDGVAIFNDRLELAYANPAFKNMMGLPASHAVTGNSCRRFVAPNNRRRLFEHVLPEVRATGRWRGELDARTPASTCFPAEVSIVRIDGNTFGCILRDITENKRQQRIMHEAEIKYRTLVDTCQDGVYVVQDGKFLYVNEAFARSLGYLVSELVGLRPREIVVSHRSGKNGKPVNSNDFTQDGKRRYELYLRYKGSDSKKLFSFHESRIELNGRNAVTGTARDVTEQRRAESRLRYNAYHDKLTGLPNRDYFLDTLHALAHPLSSRKVPEFAVIFLDLDRFKLINDTYGHGFGDRVLVEVAGRLAHCLRPNDLIARQGGDEYTIIARNIATQEDSIVIAKRLLAALAKPILVNGTEVFTGASIGIAINSPGTSDPENLLRDADIAMYHAKSRGRAGYVVFDKEMHAATQKTLQLETQLRNAIEHNEFRMAFQPIIRLSDNRLCGFESLLRWQHPERGLLPPAEFLQVLEDTGLIISEGLKCLEFACKSFRRWQKRFPFLEDATLSFNLSHRQFFHFEFLAELRRILFRSGMQPGRLCLEITESVFIDNFREAARTLQSLRETGVLLHLDDFGTGYSSLSSLHELPLNALKIEKSFIRDIVTSVRNRSLTRMIIQLASELGLQVIAEGVEDDQQLEALRGMSCHAVQGYYFAEPLLVEAMTEFLERYSAQACARES